MKEKKSLQRVDALARGRLPSLAPTRTSASHVSNPAAESMTGWTVERGRSANR